MLHFTFDIPMLGVGQFVPFVDRRQVVTSRFVRVRASDTESIRGNGFRGLRRSSRKAAPTGRESAATKAAERSPKTSVGHGPNVTEAPVAEFNSARADLFARELTRFSMRPIAINPATHLRDQRYLSVPC